MTSARVLALDVGGTNVRMTIAVVSSHTVTFEARARVATADHASLEAALEANRALFENAKIVRACVAVAGPVNDGICHMSNLGWTVGEKEITKVVGHPTRVINDFEAIARGVRYVPADKRVTLQEGLPDPVSPIAIVGAGTGLGEALLLHSERGDQVMPTEGGHATLAPVDDDDARLIARIRKHLGGGHVSVERVLQGAGMVAIFDWLVDEGVVTPTDALKAAIKAGDPAAAIGKAGTEGSDPAARAAVDRFVRFYGAEAGNLALKSLARGGVFVAGGIAPKILPRIQEGFMAPFLDKGRMRPVLEQIPVHVLTDDDVGMRGAAVTR